MDLKKSINYLIFLVLLSSLVYSVGFKEYGYVLFLGYNKGVITNENIALTNVAPLPNLYTEGDYILNLISVKGNILHTFRFDFPLVVDCIAPRDLFDEEGNQKYIPKGCGLVDGTFQILDFPYFSEATEIKIYEDIKGGVPELKLTIDVSEFNRCNLDNICQIERVETDKWCPEDCKTAPPIYWIIGIIIVILVIAYVIKTNRKI